MLVDYKLYRHLCLVEIQSTISGKNNRAKIKSRLLPELSNKKLLTNEDLRISLIKLVLSLIPESEGIIEDLLLKKSEKIDFEVQFTIFCFLDQIKDLKNAKKFASNVPNLVGEYLMNTKRNTGRAAWMAGDMLGDHWDKKAAVPVLKNVAKNAKYIAGKRAGLYGLFLVYKNSRDNRILTSLKDLRESAKNRSIKTYISNLLEK
jgi:hypothetical protein